MTQGYRRGLKWLPNPLNPAHPVTGQGSPEEIAELRHRIREVTSAINLADFKTFQQDRETPRSLEALRAQARDFVEKVSRENQIIRPEIDEFHPDVQPPSSLDINETCVSCVPAEVSLRYVRQESLPYAPMADPRPQKTFNLPLQLEKLSLRGAASTSSLKPAPGAVNEEELVAHLKTAAELAESALNVMGLQFPPIEISIGQDGAATAGGKILLGSKWVERQPTSTLVQILMREAGHVQAGDFSGVAKAQIGWLHDQALLTSQQQAQFMRNPAWVADVYAAWGVFMFTAKHRPHLTDCMNQRGHPFVASPPRTDFVEALVSAMDAALQASREKRAADKVALDVVFGVADAE